MKRVLLASLTLALVVTAQSPGYAMSMMTIAIDNYSANGEASSQNFPFNWNVSDADATANKAISKGWTFSYRDTNADAHYWDFVVDDPAHYVPWITTVDLAYFAGHSSEQGPDLGTNSGYNFNSSGTFMMDPSKYTQWSAGSLKWFLDRACLMLRYSSDTDPFNAGTWPMKRYNQAFSSLASTGYIRPNGSLHCIFGSCSDTYQAGFSVGNDFFDRVYSTTSPESNGNAWFDAMYWQAYQNPANVGGWWIGNATGIQYAVLSAYTYNGASPTVHVEDYFNESLKSPYADPSYMWNNTSKYTGEEVYQHVVNTPRYHLAVQPPS